jgi:hypothetical protein
MKKQPFSVCKKTEQLLQDIAERQEELNKLSQDIQKIDLQKSIKVDFNWISKLEENFDYLKLSKAV